MTDVTPPRLPGRCPYGFDAPNRLRQPSQAPVAPETEAPKPAMASPVVSAEADKTEQAPVASRCPVTRSMNAVKRWTGVGGTKANLIDQKALHARYEQRGGSKPFTEQASYDDVVAVFKSPIGPKADFPPDIAEVVDFIDRWNTRTTDFFTSGKSATVFRNTIETGAAIADALRLVRLTNTRRIDEWMASAETPQAAKDAFETWRTACLARTDALSQIVSDALVTGNLLGWENNALHAARHNMNKIVKFMGGKGYLWQHIGLGAGLAGVYLRERQFLSGVIGEQMRRSNVPFTRCGEARMLDRLNTIAGRPLLTERHSEVVRTAYKVLKERDVTGDAAHALIVKAMHEGHRTSGKPWKGIIRLTELVRYSCVDPKRPDFGEIFQTAMDAPIHYTHAPGAEWVVRDPVLGLKLLQMDGLIPEGEQVADLRQGQNSLIPGFFRAGVAKTKVAERYSRSLDAFLDSMVVAEGADHKRHRKAFLPFFTQRAVLEHAVYVEQTVHGILDEATAKADKNGGAFDFKKDFAYHFPIRIICRMMGLPEADVPMVQAWAETSVRAMDVEAGMTMEISNKGQIAAREFRTYLATKLEEARQGQLPGSMLELVSKDDTLSEDERIANLGVMIFAGFETTTGLLSKGMHELLQHPEQWQHLRGVLVSGPEVAVDGKVVPDHDLRWLTWAGNQKRNVDESRRDALLALVAKSAPLAARFEAIKLQEVALENAVEELLRWNAPGSVVPLTASRDLKIEMPFSMLLRGVMYEKGDMLAIRKGENIAVPIDELNRRTELWAGLFDKTANGSFDITRTENREHLSFGVRHQCIGAVLAKENAKRALDAVLRRMPDLAIDGQAVPQDMELFSGLASLPVRIPRAEA